ncbi:post-GPI attachment to proteins factor 2-like [Acropora muricata]|uniref:post-GPI attachment to proteins factor 2-like n=1 Tax=Acropora muricata TaxID=159855 RepID=UPI001CF38726|nr:post-GPI attachment to proteins factor 2-like isoform X1 [Acropora millepora]XP_029205858.2 post-GPI attachment to proteins factor 2-like isoform X1 [Acropora millepora]
MPTDDLQKALLSFSMEQFVSFISLLPLLSFASCVAVALAWHYEETTSTHCHVDNYLPSISAAIGGHMPERFIWNLGIALHCLPRIILFPAAFYEHYRSTQSGRKYNLTTWWFWLLNLFTNISQVVENGALLTLTFITSTDNFVIHETSFIVFMVCAMFYMFLSCILFKFTTVEPMSIEESMVFKRKVFIMLFNYCSFGLAVYCYFRHGWYCEAGMYTFFAFFEYCTILSNIAFHWFCLTVHFKGAKLSLAFTETISSKTF